MATLFFWWVLKVTEKCVGWRERRQQLIRLEGIRSLPALPPILQIAAFHHPRGVWFTRKAQVTPQQAVLMMEFTDHADCGPSALAPAPTTSAGPLFSLPDEGVTTGSLTQSGGSRLNNSTGLSSPGSQCKLNKSVK